MTMRTGLGTMLLVTMLAACGGETPDQAADRAEEVGRDLEQSVEGLVDEALRETRDALTDGRQIDPVGTDTLQALLPESLDGLSRADLAGGREGALGFFISTAEATYTGGEGTVELAIIDVGGVSSPSMLGYAWAEDDVNRETENTYERTTRYRSYRAHERYDRGTQEGQMAVLVADRFIVVAEGKGVPMAALEDALDRIDLDRLEEMRDVGLQPPDPEAPAE